MKRESFLESIALIMEAATSDMWVSTLMHMLYQTKRELYMHSINVALICTNIAIYGNQEKIGISNKSLILGALLHDIGYAGTIVALDGKPHDEMNPIDKMIFQRHITYGLENVSQHTSDQGILNIISMHHEFIDGSGYPKGLKNTDIPNYVRIVSIANNLDHYLRNQKIKNIDDAKVASYLEKAFYSEIEKGKYDFSIICDFCKCFQQYFDGIMPFLSLVSQTENYTSIN